MRRCLIVILCASQLFSADHTGVVVLNGVPVPGVSVTASRGETRVGAITDPLGTYVLKDLADGAWTIEVLMQLFTPQRREIEVSKDSPRAQWELAPLPVDQITGVVSSAPVSEAKPQFQRTEVTASKHAPKPPEAEGAAQAPVQAPDPAATADLAARAADGFLINGSVNNGSSSPFAQLPAFGNFRRGRRSLYNGNLGVIVNNSILDARPYSLTGQNTPKPAYSRMQAVFAFGGPIKIPGLIRRNGPMFSLNYQWTRNTSATTETALVPTAAERAGNFQGAATPPIDPTTGAPFAGAQIPQNRVSPQARALLELYPLPNFTGSSRFNYQVPIVSAFHQDDLQTRVSKQIRRHYMSGSFAWQSTRTDSPDLFGFLETGSVSGFNAAANYRRNFSPREFVNFGLQYSRLTTQVNPFFANQRNISAEAGITGNNQEPANWGPPSLRFSGGIASLDQPQSSLDRNQTTSVSFDSYMNRGRHNITIGVTHRWQQFNVLSQQDPRGSFSFTGNVAGNDFAAFLLGAPDTSSIAFGNADKYLRASVQEAFINDDWRIKPGLSVNAGLRYEYWSPIHEKYGRLVNLDVAPGFTGAAPAVQREGPSSVFPRPDRNNFAPRIGFAWRPFPASSMLVRGGYGVYYDTSVYQPIAMQMAQQSPLSKSLRIANTPATPITLADGFRAAASSTQATTFGVDPGFRVGYSQNWQLSIQRDMPWALQISATYSGGKGTRGQQQFLPNTFPDGSSDPSGFIYLTSNGSSIRHAGQLHVRRRLRSGLASSLQYTFSKSIDNSALGGRNQGGYLIAQNWLDLSAERALSNFDQRHVLTGMLQYTPGMGLRGAGASRNGWQGALMKDWTLGSQFTIGSGLPLTPIVFSPVRGTGVTGTIRPDYSGAPVYDAPSGLYLNPAAFIAARGYWGNAGRNSITGPAQVVVNASVARTFRSSERVNLDVRLEANNVLNYVTFARWNTVVGSAQFGLPESANAMRSMQAVIRMRF